jgi:hypothetical protein
MDTKSFKDYGIDVEKGINEDVAAEVVGAESDSAQRDSILLFPQFGVSPELEDQLEAVSTDPSAMLESLKANNITIDEISDEDQRKFGMKPHPLHEKHREQAA